VKGRSVRPFDMVPMDHPAIRGGPVGSGTCDFPA
jgi:hypothetical protein